jgi:two-component system CheB/CheR fusion protein
VARAGVYPRGIEADVGAERLQRFFVDADTEHCRVKKRLRERVVCAPQSLIGDAPFSRLDLISCRNLLIYLEPQVQQRIIALFHFALREGGYLLLGPSESAGRQGALFETVSKQWRLFRRLGEARREVLYFPPAMLPGHRPEPPEAAIDDSRARRRLGAAAQQLLLDEYGPAAVLLSRQLEILYLFGPTADYLQLPPGQPTLYLLDMLEEPLRTRVRAACHRALQDQRTVVVSDGRPNPGGTDPGGTTRRVEIRVRALQEPTPLSGLLLISFADLDAAPVPPAAEARAEPAAADEDQPALRQLERELEATREDLQSSVEELKASNEETMSMNEELQSANEELETSKEELQSLNEELITLNAQLREKVRELEHSNNDINNLLASTDIATVFLDTRMRIKRFTPACARLLSLRGTDLGRPLSDLALRVRDPKLHSDAERVLERLTPLEVEVDGADGSRYLRRVQPYRTQDNRIQGVVITFVDITERSRAVAAVRDSEERFRMLFERSPMCLMEQDWSGVLQCLRALCGADADSDLRTWVRAHAEQAVFCRGRVRINAINHAALALLGAGSAEQVVAASQRFLPLLPADQLLGLLDALLQGRGGVQEFQVERLDGGHIPVLLHAVPARGSEHALERVLVALIDISQRKVIEQQLAEREQRLSAILNTVADGVIGVDREGVIGELNATAQRLFGVSAAEAVGQPLTRFLRPGPPIGDNGRGIMEQLRTQGDGPPRTQLCEGVHANGDLFPAEMVGAEIDHVGLYVLLVRDISRRRELERQIIEISTREQERIGQEIHDGLGQQLTAVTLLASALAARLEKGERPEAAQARQLADQLAHALTDSRGITQGLAPVGVAPERLRDALVNLADQVQRATGITCRLEADEQTPISDPVLSAHLYRIAQEATNNAARHGKPTRIEIRLHVQDATLCLDVEDDGQWREAPQDGPGGLGLHIMGYRAGIVGGTLTVSPQPEGGTLMCCRIPLRTR